MISLYLFGWLLFALGIMLAGVEVAAHFLAGYDGMVMPAYDLWFTLSPSSLLAVREAASPGWWEGLRLVLSPPAWAVFGLPGLVLVLAFRPKPDVELSEAEHDLFLFDRLARDAEAYADDAHLREVIRDLEEAHRADRAAVGVLELSAEQRVPAEPSGGMADAAAPEAGTAGTEPVSRP